MSLPILLLFFIVFLSLLGSPSLKKDTKRCEKFNPAIFVGVILFLLFVALIALFGVRHVAKVPQTIHKAIDGVEHVADNLSNTLGDLEKELDEFTKPQIDLGEETETSVTEKEDPEEESATELKSEPKQSESLPDWVTNPPKSEEDVWRRVVETEPCFTDKSLKHERAGLIVKALSDYLAEQLDSEIPQDVLHQEERRHEFFVGAQKRGIYERHTETRETSVGDASIFHLMVSIDSSDKKWFEDQLEISRTKNQPAIRGRLVAGVALLSGAVLCGLAVLYGLLRMSEK